MSTSDWAASAQTVLGAYAIEAAALTEFPGGLINRTWQVTAKDGGTYVLQRLNSIFTAGVNDNLRRVTEFLAARGEVTPQLLPTARGDYWIETAGAIWRVLTFIAGESFGTLPNRGYARAAGALLGRFHRTLAGFPGELVMLRPLVHDPSRHMATLATALRECATHALATEVAALATNIDAALAALPPAPAAPLRIVHGDPKLSNLLFAVDGAPLCLVDLDTLAHAPLAYELGDAFRSWCNPHAEDATQATFDLGLFEGAARGYAEEMSASITIPERDAIVIATQAICLELAARFAADALREAYFGWDPSRFASRGEHNLARARGQWQLAVAVGSQRNAAEAIVRDVFST